MAIEDTETIDAILYDSEKDKLNLTIIQVNDWESIPESLALLRKKINSYIIFAFEGQIWEEYPEHKGKDISFSLECTSMPEGQISELIEDIKNHLSKYKIDFFVNLHR
jgi:hypothetical protein